MQKNVAAPEARHPSKICRDPRHPTSIQQSPDRRHPTSAQKEAQSSKPDIHPKIVASPDAQHPSNYLATASTKHQSKNGATPHAQHPHKNLETGDTQHQSQKWRNPRRPTSMLKLSRHQASDTHSKLATTTAPNINPKMAAAPSNCFHEFEISGFLCSCSMFRPRSASRTRSRFPNFHRQVPGRLCGARHSSSTAKMKVEREA